MTLVDSDIMIDILRRHQPALDWLASQSSEELVMPGFVMLELIDGCKDKASQERVLALAGRCQVVWLSEAASERAAELFVEHRLRHGFDMIDAFVAQTALELGMPLASFNRKHYACVLGLQVVEPYGRS